MLRPQCGWGDGGGGNLRGRARAIELERAVGNRAVAAAVKKASCARSTRS
jgi:hypothetical protein